MTRNPVVGAAVAVLLVVVGLFAAALPKGAEVRDLEAQLAAADDELLASRIEVEAVAAAAADGSALAALEAAKALIPPDADLPGFLRLLQDAARTAGVTLVSVSPTAPDTAAGQASEIGVGIAVAGPYFATARFVYELEHLARLVRIAGVSVTEGTEGGGVTAQITASIYTTDLTVGPGAAPDGTGA